MGSPVTDTQLYLSFPPDDSTTSARIFVMPQFHISVWMRGRHFQLNLSKTELLVFPTELRVFPTELRVFPTELLVFPTELRVFPTELLVFPTELLVFPTELCVFPTELLAIPQNNNIQLDSSSLTSIKNA